MEISGAVSATFDPDAFVPPQASALGRAAAISSWTRPHQPGRQLVPVLPGKEKVNLAIPQRSLQRDQHTSVRPARRHRVLRVAESRRNRKDDGRIY